MSSDFSLCFSTCYDPNLNIIIKFYKNITLKTILLHIYLQNNNYFMIDS